MAGTIVRQNNAEGQTNGTTVTAANSGTSGDAYDSVHAGGTHVWDSSTQLSGSVSEQFATTYAGAVTVYDQWLMPSSTSTFAFRLGFRMPTAGAPSSVAYFARVFTGTFSQGPELGINAAGQVQMYDPGSGLTVHGSTVLTAGNWYVALGKFIGGTSATVQIYGKGSTTLVDTLTISDPGVMPLFQGWRHGILVYPLTFTLNLDDVAIGTSDYLARTDVTGGGGTPPTANIAYSGGGYRFTFDGTGSTAVGAATITGYAWNFGDGSTSTSATPSHTYSAANSYSVTLVVTDSNGLSSTTRTQTVVAVAPATVATYAAPVALTGMTVTGAGDAYTALGDTSASSWVEGASGGSVSGLLNPLLTPQAGSTVKVSMVADYTGASGSIVAQLYEGTTLRSTSSSVTLAAGTSGSPLTGSINATTGAVTGTAGVQATFPAVDVATVTAWSSGTLRLILTETAA